MLEILTDDMHELTKHNEDFDLYFIGEYDDNTGKINSERPEHISSLRQLMPHATE